jgi:starvation-inducible DNA-binding protein
VRQIDAVKERQPPDKKGRNYIDRKALNGTFAEAPTMYKTENDISKNHRSELNALMNQRVASAVDLQMQMKQAHWNVKGPSFIGLHELFDKVARSVESYVGRIAGRIVQSGGIAQGTVRVSAALTLLEEYSIRRNTSSVCKPH